MPQAAGDATPAPAPKKFLGYEPLTWAKIIPLGIMFFCILFNYTILRDTKVGRWPRRVFDPACCHWLAARWQNLAPFPTVPCRMCSS